MLFRLAPPVFRQAQLLLRRLGLDSCFLGLAFRLFRLFDLGFRIANGRLPVRGLVVCFEVLARSLLPSQNLTEGIFRRRRDRLRFSLRVAVLLDADLLGRQGKRVGGGGEYHLRLFP